MLFGSRRESPPHPHNSSSDPQQNAPATSAQPEQNDVAALAQRLAVLSSRVTAVELDVDNIRNKVLRREQKKQSNFRIGGRA